MPWIVRMSREMTLHKRLRTLESRKRTHSSIDVSSVEGPNSAFVLSRNSEIKETKGHHTPSLEGESSPPPPNQSKSGSCEGLPTGLASLSCRHPARYALLVGWFVRSIFGWLVSFVGLREWAGKKLVVGKRQFTASPATALQPRRRGSCSRQQVLAPTQLAHSCCRQVWDPFTSLSL